MNVDSNGQPVSEGTFGLYGGASARVLRTFIDPTKDTDQAREVIANGGYVVDTGSYVGERVTTPENFTATYDGDSVKAQDGKLVEVGDTIEIGPGDRPDDKKSEYVVKNVYPIGTLQGTVCCSLEGYDGGAPDGKWAVAWGDIIRVVKKSSEGASASTEVATKGPWATPVGVVTVGDTVRAQKGDYQYIFTVEGFARSTTGDNDSLKLRVKEVIKGDMVVGATTVWYTKRVTEILTSTIKWVDKADVEKGDWIRFLSDENEPTSGVVDFISDGKKRIRVKLDEGEKHAAAFGSTGYWVNRGILSVRKAGTGAEMENEEQENNDMVTRKKEPKWGKVDVVKEGTQIILPDRMGLRTAIAELQRQAEQEEMDVAIMELIPGFPLDAAHAFVKTLEHKYGWVNALPTPGFFGPQPPVMIGVQVDPDGRTVQIPWGQLGIPGITGKLTTGIQFVDNKPVFCIGGTIKQKDKVIVNEIAQLTREYLKAGGSIYKGKAIRIKFPEDPKKFSPLDHQPKFIQTSDVKPEELIFSEQVEKLVNVNLWTLIRHTEAVKAARIPIKRGVLVFGKYGVGKTLLAAVTARMAVQQNVTFIDLVDSKQLPQAVPFARQLGGMVVIFAEDIDRCDENGTRSDAFNEILNTVDGLTSKTDEVVIVMTTNHIDRISPAMLRPGRLDAVVEIHPPDASAVQKLVRLYARHLLPEEEDIREVGSTLAGEIPAVVREVVERSKLAAIARGDVHHITADDLLVQAAGMKRHLELLQEKPVDDRSELEKLGDALGKRVCEGILAAYHDDIEYDTLTRKITARKVA